MDVLQGTLDLMVLQTLESMGPLHGYGIARRIEQISEDMPEVERGHGVRVAHAAPASAMDLGELGRFREQPKSQVLRDHEGRSPAAGEGDGELGAHRGRHGSAPAQRGAVLTCGRDWSRCSRGFGFAWARRRLDEEARREFDAHLDLLVERYIRSGMTPDEAHAAARRQFGNVTLVREEIYQMNGIGWVDGLAQDLRYAFRQLRRSPGFSAVVIATLALGIGGTTAVFSVVQAVLLAPLPYEQPGQLVRFYQQEPDKPDTRHYLDRRRISRRFAITPRRSRTSRRSTTTPRPDSTWSRMGRRSGSACCRSRATTSAHFARTRCAAGIRPRATKPAHAAWC